MRAKAQHLVLLVAGGLLAAAIVAGVSAARSPRAGSSASVVLGQTTSYPDSGCPAPDKCEVVARVTGIQMMADAAAHPFRSPVDGQLVAWWVRLPQLEQTQLKSFNSLFGGDPSARISILRRGKRGRFRLVRQGPTQPLRADLGQKGRVHYRLPAPLPVSKGDYVGLTAVTWVPAFAVGLDGSQNYWLASRPRSKCDTPSSKTPKRFADYYKKNQAHLTTSTVKLYQCTYRTARLLYWARVVPNPSPTATPAPSPKKK